MTVPTELKNHGLLSPGEVAERTGRHRSTIWQWMEQFNADGQALLPSYFVDSSSEKPRLVLYRKGAKRPHYRGVRPEDIQPWHKASGDVSRVRSASGSKQKPNGRKAVGRPSTRRQRARTKR